MGFAQWFVMWRDGDEGGGPVYSHIFWVSVLVLDNCSCTLGNSLFFFLYS